MIIVMRPQADEADIARVVDTIRQRGLREHISRGQECTIIGAVGDERVFDPAELERLPQVEKAIRIVHGWRLISREAHAEDTVITVRGIRFGGADSLKTVAYAPEGISTPQYMQAEAVLFDPFYVPANPYAATPAANEKEATRRLLEQTAAMHADGRAVFVRIRDSQHIQAALAADADVVYLGGELLSNRHILHELGSLNIPVVVCKNSYHNVHDWLLAAEQIVLRGNQLVMLGEAGTLALNTEHLRLDTDAIARAKILSHLPVLADVSRLAHRYMDSATLVRLAEAAGADVVVTPNPMPVSQAA